MAHRYVGDVPFTTQATRNGKRKLLMDFGLPDPNRWPGPWPVILIIHGGTWVGWRLQEDLPWHFVDEHGFALARIDYRTAYDASFPAQISDCRSAVRFVRQHAAEYGIDPDRIGVCGTSSGGHIAAMVGVGDGAEGLDNDGDDPSVSVAVQAVVDNFGPTNILELWQLLDKVDRYIRANPLGDERRRLYESLVHDPNTSRHFIRGILDGPLNWLTALPFSHRLTYIKHPSNLLAVARSLSGWDGSQILNSEELLRRVSPIEYVKGSLWRDGRKIPPFRILHGEEDCMVPFAQSRTFADALRVVGADVTFDTDCGGGGHFPNGDYWWKVIIPKEVEFFNRTLK